jgi:hypothetical protein
VKIFAQNRAIWEAKSTPLPALFIRNSGFYIILNRGGRGYWQVMTIKSRLKNVASDPMLLTQSIEATRFQEQPVTARHTATNGEPAAD